MRKAIFPSLLCLFLLSTLSSLAQVSVSNTSSTFTMTNSSCFMISGNYEIAFSYDDPFLGINVPAGTPIPATLTQTTGPSSIFINAPGANFPTSAVNGFNFSGQNIYDGGAGPYGTNATIWLYQNGSPSARFDINFTQAGCQALPITLGSFYGSSSSCVVTLNWSTESESNSSHFVIERNSYNGATTYMKVGSVAAAGDSYSTLNYSFTDNYPNNGTNYYRLRMVDLDGSIEYSSTITVSSPGCTAAPPQTNCSSISITGSDALCNVGNTYYLSAEPNYSTISWSITPTTIADWGGNKMAKAWIKKTGDGIATLQASLTNCSAGGTITKPITVGNTSYYVTRDTLQKDALSTRYRLTATYIPGTTDANYSWTKDGVYYASARMLVVDVPFESCDVYRLTLTFPCGQVGAKSFFLCYAEPSDPFGKTMVVDPVPASTVINIKLKSLRGGLKPGSAYLVELLDLYGNLQRRKKMMRLDTKQQLDISNVPNGLYILKVSNGKEVYTREIKILH